MSNRDQIREGMTKLATKDFQDTFQHTAHFTRNGYFTKKIAVVFTSMIMSVQDQLNSGFLKHKMFT